MNQSSLLPPPSAHQDRRRLCCSFHASSLRQAVSLAAELRTTAADGTQVHPSSPGRLGPQDWIVTLTTPPMMLALDVLEPWEGEMLDVEHRWPGCRFLGWRAWRAPAASIGPKDWPGDDAAGARWRRSQRELVIASLLRCPLGGRRGVVHGKGVPR